MENIAYLAMDVHVRQILLAHMNGKGEFRKDRSFPPSERNIEQILKSVKAKSKYLALEEGTLTYWVAQIAKPWVTEVITCDPRENALIFKSPNKRDKVDGRKLCRLLRLGELKRVYQPENDERAVFKATAKHYIDLREQQMALKQKIKAVFRHWGVIDVTGEAVYSVKGRDHFLKKIRHIAIHNQLNHLYRILDETETMQALALKEMKKLGRKYPEIREFKKISGIADVGAHVFDAFIQTPHRFAHKQQLWRYCRMGVTERSSDGKPLGYKKLDRSGISELKAISYRAWMASMKGDNEVRRFYSNSLRRTLSHVHARLNTQRKIVAVMYGLWKRGQAYNPQFFLGSP